MLEGRCEQVIIDAMHSPADEWVPAGVSDDGRDNPIGLQPAAGSDAGAKAMKCNVRSGVHPFLE
ncbi:MAG: hypothetical protein CL992_02375 [Euryarchaeota archaeon]|nr:hypothetical protein [Euryarchaeota archaeon]|tara:strand:+ start:439 stop:630 length:192 start_codon:yes stop_codon:yes gene_type:complete